MEETDINNKTYINADYLIKNLNNFAKGCRSSRELIKKKNIDDFIYLKKKDDIWIESSGKSIKYDKVFINKDYIKSIPKINREIIKDNKNEAPPIIELKESEKFKDDDGNILDIETRGEREVEKIFFKCKDIEKYFDHMHLQNTVIDKESKTYKEDIDYKYFYCKKIDSKKNEFKKLLFLTYGGLVRVLFLSRNVKTNNFINWATKILFTMKMGTNEQKKELFDKVLGYDLDETRKLIKSNTNGISVVYLLSLGYVKDLKNMTKRKDRNQIILPENVKDDDIVFKYGFTKDYSERLRQHKKNFSEFEVKSRLFSYIDERLLSDAENYVKHSFDFNACKVRYQDYNELFVISKDKVKLIENIFFNLSNIYSGDKSYYIEKLKSQKVIFENQLLEKDLELSEVKRQRDIATKDKEIAELKLQLALNK